MHHRAPENVEGGMGHEWDGSLGAAKRGRFLSHLEAAHERQFKAISPELSCKDRVLGVSSSHFAQATLSGAHRYSSGWKLLMHRSSRPFELDLAPELPTFSCVDPFSCIASSLHRPLATAS